MTPALKGQPGRGLHGMRDMEAGPIAYLEGQYLPIAEAKISVLAHAFNYGTGVFEGIRGYWNPDDKTMRIFRLPEHIDRLARNMRMLFMEIPEDRRAMEEICCEIVRQSGFEEDVYIRPITYKSAPNLVPKVHDLASDFCCYVIRLGNYVDIDEGLDVCVTSFRRVSDNAIPTRVKSTASYLNSALAASEAKMGGFAEAIFLREDGTVSEGSAMNIFMVRDGILYTPPPQADILVGITRDTIIQLARERFGMTVVERAIARTELYVCDELFFTGTGAQVSPIRSVDRRPIGTGKPGEITRKLQQFYFQVVQGRVSDYAHWCTPVT